jgi:predicted HicB family RNase H-like nuclease
VLANVRGVPKPKQYDEERVSTAIRFPASIHDRLIEEAEERVVSVNYLVTRAVERFFAELDGES